MERENSRIYLSTSLRYAQGERESPKTLQFPVRAERRRESGGVEA